MKSNKLERYSSIKIRQLMSKKDLEDASAVAMIEKFLKKKRGYVFRMPKPGQPVVLQLSGGIDSVTTAAMLMELYGLVIYPLFLRRGQSRVKKEEASVDYFSKIFFQKYPTLFRPVFKMNTRVPPFEIRADIIKFSNQKLYKNSERRLGIPMYASLLTSFAVEYAYYLEITQSITTRTIFCAAIEADGVQMAHHTLTGLRGINLDICCQTSDYSWQFTSPWTEKEMGRYHSKKDLIRWGWEHNLPTHRSWSCYFNGIFHCGKCNGCLSRRSAHKSAGVADLTLYQSDFALRTKIKQASLYFLDAIKSKLIS